MEPFFRWLSRNVLPFNVAGVAAFGGSRMVAGYLAANRWSQFGAMVAGSLVYAAVAYLFLDPALQSRLSQWWSRKPEIPEASIG